MSVLKPIRQRGTNAWACSNCPVVLTIEPIVNTWVSVPFIISTLLRIFAISYSNSIKWDLSSRTSRQIQRLTFGFTSGKMIGISVIQKSKVLEWKQQFVASFVNRHTWQTPVDNCDNGIRKRDRDCATFAFHQCSANSKSSKKILDECDRNVWNVTADRSSAINLDSGSVSTENLNRLIGSFF